MPNSTKNGINYSEEELAKKRTVVLDFLAKQKSVKAEPKKAAPAKPAVVLPSKPVQAPAITLPKTEKKAAPIVTEPPAPVPVTDIAATPPVEPISQFLGTKKREAQVEVDFLEDVKKETLVKPDDAEEKQKKRAKKINSEMKLAATGKAAPPPAKIIPTVKKDPVPMPRVDLLEDIKKEDARPSNAVQWAEIGAILVMICAAFYFLICLYFFTFKPQAPFFRQIAKVVPVPGLVSTYGFVEIYQYLDLKESLSGKGVAKEDLADAATSVSVEWQILEQLARYYQLPPTTSAAAMLDNLGKAVVSDKEINASAFSTIRKVKQEISNGMSFEEAAGKHGAMVAKEYFAVADAKQKFGPSFESLADGAISSIVVSPDGFYIVQKVASSRESVEARYLLVKPKTLSDIVDERLAKARAINFAQ